MKYNIAVVGAGYVGLVTGACLAELGNKVFCIDNNSDKIKMLKALKIPIYEPGLERLVIKNVKRNKLFFTTNIGEGIKEATIVFIAVGTPPKENGEADVSAIENVSKIIAQHMTSYKLIVGKSTVPVETGKWIDRTIKLNLKKDVEFDVASNPEFLREGSAISDFFNPDRIVLGVSSKRALDLLLDLYKPIKAPKLITDIASSELIKHASNSFLALKISYINAIARICELSGADISQVADGIGMDKRIGRAFLDAGIGFGGFCFPKDLDAFIKISENLGYDFKLLKVVREINEKQKELFFSKIKSSLWNINSKIIGVLGLSFKPETDDLRFAPSLSIIEMLKKEGACIKAYDPKAMEKAKSLIKDITFCKNAYEVAKECECLLIITEWSEFKNLDFKRLKKLMKRRLIIDGRNILDKERLNNLGFEYIGIGR